MRRQWPKAYLSATMIVVIAACGASTSQETGAVGKLISAPVATGDVTRVVTASGKIVPRDEVMVGSEVSGRILEVSVDFNSEVKAGDRLAQIDPQAFENRLKQLEGRLQSALADIKVRRASIDRAEINLSQAQSVLKRQEDLFTKSAVSQARLDEAKQAAGVARADLDLAKAQLESSQAQVSQIRAELASAKLDLDRTSIRSPIDGVIIDRKIDPGQTVQASFSAPELFVLAADLSDIRVEAQIVESDVAGMQSGDEVTFSVDAYPDLTLTGTIEQLRLKSSEANNIVTYVAVVAARNEQNKLMPGMTANLEITTEVKSGVMRIPAQAERFRPTPDQIKAWETTEDSAGVDGDTDINASIYTRLERIGIGGSELSDLKDTIERSSKPFLDVINDPEKSFMHTPSKIQLAELIDNLLKTELNPERLSEYKALVSAERDIREVWIWVLTADQKMQRRAARLGLSDGAYIEVVSGLAENDQVITGIRAEESGTAGTSVRG